MLSKKEQSKVDDIVKMQGSEEGAIQHLYFERKFAVEGMYQMREYMIRILQENPIENMSLTRRQRQYWDMIEEICGSWENTIPIKKRKK